MLFPLELVAYKSYIPLLYVVGFSPTHYRTSFHPLLTREGISAEEALWREGPTRLKVLAMVPLALALATPVKEND